MLVTVTLIICADESYQIIVIQIIFILKGSLENGFDLYVPLFGRGLLSSVLNCDHYFLRYLLSTVVVGQKKVENVLLRVLDHG
jgi:hypothetical protein